MPESERQNRFILKKFSVVININFKKILFEVNEACSWAYLVHFRVTINWIYLISGCIYLMCNFCFIFSLLYNIFIIVTTHYIYCLDQTNHFILCLKINTSLNAIRPQFQKLITNFTHVLTHYF